MMDSFLTFLIAIFLIYYLIVSAIGIKLTISDKKKAIRGEWRVPEAKIMFWGLLGGALPIYLTMKKIRHKTQHAKFMIGLPAEMILHLFIVVSIFVLAY